MKMALKSTFLEKKLKNPQLKNTLRGDAGSGII
jgi:hypothetical protein